MARFPDTAPIPTPRPAQLIPPAGSKPGYGHDMTLDALMARQQELAAQQGQVMQQGASNIPQGLAQMAWTLVNALGERKAAKAEAEGRAEVGEAFKSFDPATGMLAPEAMETIMRRAPDTGLDLYKQAMALRAQQAQQETFTTLTPEEATKLGLDPTKDYQRSGLTGKVDQIGGGGTSVTVNPPSAETSAKLGLAKGFTDNYESIIRSAEAGEMTGGGYISSVQLGRGPGGEAYRNLLQGTEAMVRLLTGAGMSEGEARSRVVQYEPALTDDAPTLVSKIKGLKQALDNVAEGVQTRGRENAETPDATTPEAEPYEVDKVYTFRQGKAKYLGGDISDPKSWETVP